MDCPRLAPVRENASAAFHREKDDCVFRVAHTGFHGGTAAARA